MIDTHCHLYLPEFDEDREKVLKRGTEAGVSAFFLPAIDSATHEAMIRLEEARPGICYAMAGLHPCSVKEKFREELSQVEAMLEKRRFIAIGETGLDFYWDKTFVKEQYESLEFQIELALTYQLPLVLHTRNATRETIDFIKPYISKGLRGVFHCFGGSEEEARDIISMDFYLGIGGVLTYKNAGLDKVMASIDLDHVILETDSPYLTPVPFRGKRNESSYLKLVAEKLASIKSLTPEEIDRITTENSIRLFRPY
jgi:TatD DNase family protein